MIQKNFDTIQEVVMFYQLLLLIITGGVDHEYTECYFDADTNGVNDF